MNEVFLFLFKNIEIHLLNERNQDHKKRLILN